MGTNKVTVVTDIRIPASRLVESQETLLKSKRKQILCATLVRCFLLLQFASFGCIICCGMTNFHIGFHFRDDIYCQQFTYYMIMHILKNHMNIDLKNIILI